MNTGIYAWKASSGAVQTNYMAAVMLTQGTVFNIKAINSVQIVANVFSAYLIDAAPVAAFSVQSLGNYSCAAGANMFASATAVTELYNTGGYASGVYTAEQAGAYHFNYFARYSDGSGKTPGVYVTINNVVWHNNAGDSGYVYGYDDQNAARRHYLPYAFDVPLNQGDQVQLRSINTDTILYQEFSGYFIGEGLGLAIDVPRTYSLRAEVRFYSKLRCCTHSEYSSFSRLTQLNLILIRTLSLSK